MASSPTKRDPNSVRIVEVGPRDGLQNISARVPTNVKIELISRLRDCGFQSIELTSIVSPRAVPQLADCRDVLSHDFIRGLVAHSKADGSGLRLPVLIPNLKGLALALKLGVKEVAVFVSASEGFSKANINCSVDEGLKRATQVAQAAKAKGVAVRGYVSCIFADPYDGPTPPSAVMKATRSLLDAGCYEVSLGDTLGIGVAGQVRSLVRFLRGFDIPIHRLAGHFHDTYGQALSNVWEAYQCGLRVFDSSVAGLGGCPFAPGAKGNVASEDVVYMFGQAGVPTNVNLQQLIRTGGWISEQLKISNTSRAGTALLTKQRLASTVKQASPQKAKATTSKTPVRLTWTPVPGYSDSKSDLLISRFSASVLITLNRPRNGNALTRSMISSLTSFFKSASTDDTIHRICITNSGTRFFCTGMDLSASGTAVGKSSQNTSVAKPSTPLSSSPSSSQPTQLSLLSTLFDTIAQSPKVTIAAVNGACFGGGVGLAFACDLRIFSSNASITLSEVKLGLAPATISRYVIREFGVGFAREAMLSARRVGAAELERKGVLSVAVVDLADVAGSAGAEQKWQSARDAYLLSLRTVSPEGTAMVKQLADLGWMYPGSQRQEEGIGEVFNKMMRKGGDGDWGVKEFQGGNRSVDWDEASARRRKEERKPKL